MEQRSLFDLPTPEPASGAPVTLVPAVAGLRYLPDFCTEVEERALIAAIDQGTWTHEYKRRRQHFGRRYDARGDDAEATSRTMALPAWVQPIADRLASAGAFPRPAEACLVNEYLPGQGIAPHVDRPGAGPLVASLSLGSGCVMDLHHGKRTHVVEHVYLARRSLIVLAGEARHDWRHGIAPRKSDTVDGQTYPRSRRLSITLRLAPRDVSLRGAG